MVTICIGFNVFRGVACCNNNRDFVSAIIMELLGILYLGTGSVLCYETGSPNILENMDVTGAKVGTG